VSGPRRGAPGRQRIGNCYGRPPRRFPSPWHADTIPGGYVVRDASGQSIAYVYRRETEVETRQANVLTKDEARRIAANIARLPELLGKGERE
jgi:hypothetical protein